MAFAFKRTTLWLSLSLPRDRDQTERQLKLFLLKVGKDKESDMGKKMGPRLNLNLQPSLSVLRVTNLGRG